jgi:predicted DNA repair protein MutK
MSYSLRHKIQIFFKDVLVMMSLLTLLDDIAATLDDVAIMTKVALKKTSALMTDDLAVNSSVIQGVNADRELPIVKAIFYGSLINKVYCIAGIMLLSAFVPVLLKVVLVIGGVYLCYEGAHKVVEKLGSLSSATESIPSSASEDEKIKGAIRTDLILSIEIIVIAQNSLTGSFLIQLSSLALIGLAASVLIYGLVALLIKVDDFGLYLIRHNFKKIGMPMVASMPYIMRGLGVVGTIAMFLVGGGILTHIFHLPSYLPSILQDMIIGLLTGISVVGVMSIKNKIKK